MLPQLAEGLALAWEPLVAAVCSRHRDSWKQSCNTLNPRGQREPCEPLWDGQGNVITQVTQAIRHVATIQDMILRRWDLNHWRIQA